MKKKNKKTYNVLIRKKAVEHAILFLQKLGFLTSIAQNECANGHDIVAIKNGNGFTFEVKPVLFKQRSYKTSKISKQSSDGIIYVFQNGNVQIDSMKNHLANCSKDGSRFLTFIGNCYE